MVATVAVLGAVTVMAHTTRTDACRAYVVVQPALAFVAQLRLDAGSSASLGALAAAMRSRAAPIPGVTVEGPGGNTVTVRFAAPSVFPLAQVARQLGWGAGYLVSGDVTQRSWHFVLSAGQIAPERIGVETPHIGAWDVRIIADARPAGPLPPLVGGASPAYDAMRYPASAVAIEFTLRR